MKSRRLPVGSFVRIAKPQLQPILDRLRELGYRTIGPRLADGAIVYDDLQSVDQLPIGYLDHQDGGFYRLEASGTDAWFDYVVGPHSLKNFLFPPRDRVLEVHRREGSWDVSVPEPAAVPLAVIGVRSCDLHALAIQDRIFLHGPYVDPAYQARREKLFVVAVNCRRAAATCFCHSMGTGPAVKGAFDLALTELDDQLVLEVGSDLGGDVVTSAEWIPCSLAEVERARELPNSLRRRMERGEPRSSPAAGDGQASGESGVAEAAAPAKALAPSEAATPAAPRDRHLETRDIHELLLDNLEHPHWDRVAQRCLACANCTLVCPTCFCSSVEELADLSGDHVVRQRSWASCFTAEHSYMNSGAVRKTTASRYRQWLTHKLATWIDQFGMSGCVGCGRCITWCPVAIDLTEEVAAIRGESR